MSPSAVSISSTKPSLSLSTVVFPITGAVVPVPPPSAGATVIASSCPSLPALFVVADRVHKCPAARRRAAQRVAAQRQKRRQARRRERANGAVPLAVIW